MTTTVAIAATYYTVQADDRAPIRTRDLETAIRTWDSFTYAADRLTVGGIRVETHQGGLVVRDGWLLHVQPSGVVYLSPSLTERSR